VCVERECEREAENRLNVSRLQFQLFTQLASSKAVINSHPAHSITQFNEMMHEFKIHVPTNKNLKTIRNHILNKKH